MSRKQHFLNDLTSASSKCCHKRTHPGLQDKFINIFKQPMRAEGHKEGTDSRWGTNGIPDSGDNLYKGVESWNVWGIKNQLEINLYPNGGLSL